MLYYYKLIVDFKIEVCYIDKVASERLAKLLFEN